MQLRTFLRNVGNLRHTTWPHIPLLKHLGAFVIIKWRDTSLSHNYEINIFLRISIFWDVTPCSPLKVNWRFGEIYPFHLQGRPLIGTCFTLISCLAYSLTLKLGANYSSEMSVDFQWATRRYSPGDGTLHNHLCENLKSYKTRFYRQQTVQTKIAIPKISSNTQRYFFGKIDYCKQDTPSETFLRDCVHFITTVPHEILTSSKPVLIRLLLPFVSGPLACSY
jgi:hypothetical protein